MILIGNNDGFEVLRVHGKGLLNNDDVVLLVEVGSFKGLESSTNYPFKFRITNIKLFFTKKN